MEKFFAAVVRKRRLVMLVLAVVLAVSAYGLLNTKINSDITSYLPKDARSKQAIDVLSQRFGVKGDGLLCVQGELAEYDDIARLADEIAAQEHVDAVLWLGTYAQALNVTKDGVTSSTQMIPDKNAQTLAKNYFVTDQGRGYYIMQLSLTVPNSSGVSGVAMDEVRAAAERFSKAHDGREYYMGGNAMQGKNMMDSALGDLPKFMILAVLVISVILFFTSKSLMSAVIFLATIGLSIFVNMGTNVRPEGISTITFSVAAILQLALSMDFSIFLTHAYERAREGEPSDERALVKALCSTCSVVAASAMTTVAGFMALFAMKFTLGIDMGLCLAKGVAVSFLMVILVQPCLMMIFKKQCDKTHWHLHPQMDFLARVPRRIRKVVPFVLAALVVPALLLSTGMRYYYMSSSFDAQPSGAQKVIQQQGSQNVLVVEKVSDEKQLALLERLEGMTDGEAPVLSVTGYYSLVKTLADGLSVQINDIPDDGGSALKLLDITLSCEEILQYIQSGVIPEAVQARVETQLTGRLALKAVVQTTLAQRQKQTELGRALTAQERNEVSRQTQDALKAQYEAHIAGQMASLSQGGLLDQMDEMRARFFTVMDGKEYTYFVLNIGGSPESEPALAQTRRVQDVMREILGQDVSFYSAGNSQVVIDMADTTTTDFVIVAVLSAVMIFIILVLTFRKFWLPLLLVLLIELAILVNLSITALSGGTINFMSYIIISAIQMGATIDYAILLTKSVLSHDKALAPADAVAAAMRESAFSVLVSMTILGSACMSVFVVSADAIIREITLLIARGAFISAVLVLVALPALLCLRRDKTRSAAQKTAKPM